MKTTVSLHDFREAFRSIRPDNFSHEGLEVLFDYMEDCERDTGEEYELDVIALCCDFSEDEDEDIANNFSIDLSECEDADDIHEAVREYLMDEGIDIGEVSGGFVYRNA